MTLNNSNQAVVDARRTQVARLRLRGMTQREIQTALASIMLNPQGDKAYSIGTIVSDLKALHQQWCDRATTDIGEHKAALLAELAEVKREGWKTHDMPTVLRAIQQERAILGLDAPVKTDVTSGGEPIPVSIIEVVKERGE